jgi:hypothetical protein
MSYFADRRKANQEANRAAIATHKTLSPYADYEGGKYEPMQYEGHFITDPATIEYLQDQLSADAFYEQQDHIAKLKANNPKKMTDNRVELLLVVKAEILAKMSPAAKIAYADPRPKLLTLAELEYNKKNVAARYQHYKQYRELQLAQFLECNPVSIEDTSDSLDSWDYSD